MTHPERLPIVLALVMTGLNAVKPAVVDDPAYLAMAAHLSQHPLDPYGFEQFWYSRPTPAMEVLAPPVLPYWLAGGYALVGDNLPLLKLMLFPFAWAFAAAAFALLRRFARGTDRPGTVMLALSPAVLPLFNVMLDVPAVALGLACVAVFVRGIDTRRIAFVTAAGVLMGLAIQTKYTMLTIPAVVTGYALLHRRVGPAVLAVGIGFGLAVGWDLLLVNGYGESHFWHHAAGEAAGTLAEKLSAKIDLGLPLLTYFGGLAFAWGLYGGRAAGFPPAAVRAAAGAAAVAFGWVILDPAAFLPPRPPAFAPRFGLAQTTGWLLGLGLLVTIGLCLTKMLVRRPTRLRWSADSWFLAGWLVVEVAGAFALTPFPAGRRVMMLSVVVGLIACRAVSRLGRLNPARCPPRWVPVYAVGVGLTYYALDAWDALPERLLPGRAAAVIAAAPGGRGPGTVWTQGHWGWQYYTARQGFTAFVPGRTVLQPGDWYVHPAHPPGPGFYRPVLATEAPPDLEALVHVGGVIWDDRLPYQTIPTLYGGAVPVLGRGFPRLSIEVYRVVRPWTPTAR